MSFAYRIPCGESLRLWWPRVFEQLAIWMQLFLSTLPPVAGLHGVCISSVTPLAQVLWYESGQLRDYAVFAAGAALTSAWFLHHHFWFLEVCAKP